MDVVHRTRLHYVRGPWDRKIGIGMTIPGAIALAKAGQPNGQADPLS